MAISTLKVIKGIETNWYIENGLGKKVFNIIAENTNYILDDEDVHAFGEKSDFYTVKAMDTNNRTYKVLSKEYSKMYEKLVSLCAERKRVEDEKKVCYPSMDDYHLNYNDSFAKYKIGGLRYGI